MKKLQTTICLAVLSGLICLSACKKNSQDSEPDNATPVANAGNDTIIYYPYSYAILNGGDSFDPDGDTNVKYTWISTYYPTQVVIHDNSMPTTSTINLVKPGEYKFQLIAVDSKGAAAEDSVKITVEKRPCSNTNEIILKDQVWYDDGWGFMTVAFEYDPLVGPGSNFDKMFIKRDGSTEWEEVIVYDLYEMTPDKHVFSFGKGWFYVYSSDKYTVDDTPDIKIVYCN